MSAQIKPKRSQKKQHPKKTDTRKAQPTFLAGKVSPSHYDDVVNRTFKKLDRFEETAPGNGD